MIMCLAPASLPWYGYRNFNQHHQWLPLYNRLEQKRLNALWAVIHPVWHLRSRANMGHISSRCLRTSTSGFGCHWISFRRSCQRCSQFIQAKRKAFRWAPQRSFWVWALGDRWERLLEGWTCSIPSSHYYFKKQQEIVKNDWFPYT